MEIVERYANALEGKAAEITELLMWEICKNYADAKKEVDRTIKYIRDTLQAVRNLHNR